MAGLFVFYSVGHSSKSTISLQWLFDQIANFESFSLSICLYSRPEISIRKLKNNNLIRAAFPYHIIGREEASWIERLVQIKLKKRSRKSTVARPYNAFCVVISMRNDIQWKNVFNAEGYNGI